MIREELEELLQEFIDDNDDINMGDKDEVERIVEYFFESKEIYYTDSCDEMFDSCGLDIYSYSIAWIENNEPEILVYRMIRD